MKAFRLTVLALAVLAALFGYGVYTASAQGPVTFVAPVNAPYLDTQSHTIAPNQSALFRFDYVIPDPTSRPYPLTTIRLPNGLHSGLNFEVWTPEHVTNLVDNDPVGRGSPERFRCDVSETSPEGWCTTGDMIWIGAFGTSGPYYARLVTNNIYNPMASQAFNASTTTTGGMPYRFVITGDAVRLGGSPIAVTGPEATGTATPSAPEATSTPAATNTPSTAETATSTPAMTSTPSAAETATSTPAVAMTSTPSAAETATSTPAAAMTSTPSAAETATSTPAAAMTSTPSVAETTTSTPAAATTPPTGTTPSASEGPTNAVTLDGSQQITIPANSSQWYSFSSTGTSTSTTVTLDLGTTGSTSLTANDVKVEVYGPDVVNSWPNSQPANTATMQGNQFSWTGTLAAAGTHYVRVVNNTQSSLSGTLTVQK
ncbi:MAG: hypothetical protein HZB51_01405 [Chloroflexi bacterium]|nr:hypothetical protein [Chloroflexota bacterium]